MNYIVDEIIDEESGSDIDDDIDSHLNFSVSDSYVGIKNNFIDSKNIKKIVTIIELIMKKYNK